MLLSLGIHLSACSLLCVVMKRVMTVLVVVGISGWIGFRLWTLEDRHNPLAPLNLEEVPGWLTDFKLRRAQRDPAVCARLAAGLQWRIEPVPDRQTGENCGFNQAWRVTSMGDVAVGDAFALSCASVLSLAMWQRHTVEPAAEQYFGEPVRRIQHLGSYACRNIYGRQEAARSRHATAEAIDIAGFWLRSGRRITISRDWSSDAAQGAFLHQLHDGGCRWFNGALGPEYNAAHRDHFHLETGGWRLCR